MKNVKVFLLAAAALSVLLFGGCTGEPAEPLPDISWILDDVSALYEEYEGDLTEDETDGELILLPSEEEDDEKPQEQTQSGSLPDEPQAGKEELPEEDVVLPPVPSEEAGDEPEEHALSPPESTLDKHGSYTAAEDVALYLHTYGKLPENFITKAEAQKKGWEGGALEPYAHGKCIGGTYFGNYEGLLPEEEGRVYHECDIDTLGNKKSRGEKRIVYSNDGLIYYTDDHYETFTLLYGKEEP